MKSYKAAYLLSILLFLASNGQCQQVIDPSVPQASGTGDATNSSGGQVDLTTTIIVVITVVVGVGIITALIFLLRRRLVIATTGLEQGNGHPSDITSVQTLPPYEFEEKVLPGYDEAMSSAPRIRQSVEIIEERRPSGQPPSYRSANRLFMSTESLLAGTSHLAHLRSQMYGIPMSI